MEGQPCPYKIVDDMGGAFAMGVFGGGIYHFFRGWRNSPKRARFNGAITSVKLRAPATGGAFALWGCSFCTFDCTFIYLRKKEDPWNAIMAGACTGGILAARAGTRAIVTGAAVGGILLGVIEGAGLMLNRLMASPGQKMSPQIRHKPRAPPPAATNIYGMPTDSPQRLSSELGFNDVIELEEEDRF
mmetsp:Transcript_26987/g.37546  ORF Transcript_26987/g.37546 Transcript_26987/m.37546 type:complete len:187 (-) Transcript_26987:204-764(-)|eukprot:CAMPEP_0184491520 /NCGR_PEP_ID=MMETSP0113_2-20130426/20595_1 /TAXON_ID=91329 /ORGANISM="Norrisiella sphaerica, Strain BC52" /LENGTH=186 /DNA_ID=CAMNT_0026875925 /DNA_START=109 /DNA_END=669 /DNA_ORIENTATION=-